MLDPHRLGLNAESIGFQKRMLQDVDFDAMQRAMQTDYNNQNSAVQVRREREAAKNEIRVMGGQLSGFESNELLLTYARQQRQINGYPLRHFDANNPAVVLPKKYGGFPMYNRNQTEYPELVSVFTEPMSAPLQRDTELLGRAGAVAMSNDLNNPYSAEMFMNPLNHTMSELEQNKSVFIQRKHLQNMSDTNRRLKGATGGMGVFVNKDGTPMTTIDDKINGQIVQNNTFGGAQGQYADRATQLMEREMDIGGFNGPLMTDGNTNEMGFLQAAGNLPTRAAVGRDDPFLLRDIEEDILGFTRPAPEELNQAVQNATPYLNFRPPTFTPRSLLNGMQGGELMNIGTPLRFGLSPIPSTKRDKRGRKYKGAIKKRWEEGMSESAQKYIASKRVNTRIMNATPGMMAYSPSPNTTPSLI